MGFLWGDFMVIDLVTSWDSSGGHPMTSGLELELGNGDSGNCVGVFVGFP